MVTCFDEVVVMASAWLLLKVVPSLPPVTVLMRCLLVFCSVRVQLAPLWLVVASAFPARSLFAMPVGPNWVVTTSAGSTVGAFAIQPFFSLLSVTHLRFSTHIFLRLDRHVPRLLRFDWPCLRILVSRLQTWRRVRLPLLQLLPSSFGPLFGLNWLWSCNIQ
ncbi:hypothetical protein, unlikely [Trypanosoma brucei gambiense DAL972]|uniref:Uncharacterized protein n=1 Tax=Trypanosoma brucei gambiense (strain MHOM/CI/86/DAL972) TaxID=679716 RepID=C9ZQ16_TRYB9|nr:hypothetical protein, unlikely [Trypanosoma brucei gambiense DAL972]CBH11494.1 hypothetical protein, unlikely [Trypanosoma brucei gambiense DAL972]|eukprot:XP_011773781.1 hypothetical protein, unlikely [Trypanosoma brucei gambiense DAL972]